MLYSFAMYKLIVFQNLITGKLNKKAARSATAARKKNQTGQNLIENRLSNSNFTPAITKYLFIIITSRSRIWARKGDFLSDSGRSDFLRAAEGFARLAYSALSVDNMKICK